MALQPAGSWCASPQDDTPLWKTVNQDFCLLNELCDMHHPRLKAKLRGRSEEYARRRLQETSSSSASAGGVEPGSSTTQSTTAEQAPVSGQQHLATRVAALEADIQELVEFKCQLSSVLERVRNNLLAYALSEEFTEQDLAKVFQPAVVRAYSYHVADLLGKSKPKDPYTPYNATLADLEQTINLVPSSHPPKPSWSLSLTTSFFFLQFKAVKMLHYPTITKTALLLFEKTKVTKDSVIEVRR